MWRLKAPIEERRNSASVVELQRAQKLAEARIKDVQKSPSLRRANSCKEKDSDSNASDSYLKIPYAHQYGVIGKDTSKLLSKKHSGSDSKIHKTRSSPRMSPKNSPKPRKRSHERGFTGLNFILGNSSKSKDGRHVKDLRQGDTASNEDTASEGKRSRSNSAMSSLTDIPEIRRGSETTSLMNGNTENCKLSSYHSCDYFFKIMMVGDSGTGKTCFATRFKDGVFLSGSFIATVGIDYKSKIISVGGKQIQLQVWDTAGQERFRSLVRNQYKDVQGIILLYDVHYRESFNNLVPWINEIRQQAKNDVVTILVGNKCDLPDSQRRVTYQEGEDLARAAGIPFLEASAKTGLNVELAFTAIARQLKANYSMDETKFCMTKYIEESNNRNAFFNVCGECRIC